MAVNVRNHSVDRYLDWADHLLSRSGLRRPAGWELALRRPEPKLYAGRVRRGLPQWNTHVGLTPFFPNSRNIPHDVRAPHAVPDNSIVAYQSEDVFEHVPLEDMPAIIADIYRILRPGGLFRMSLPDYGFPGYATRSLKDDAGAFLFDPGGGGQYVDGKVVGGGHLWFPTYEIVRDLMAGSPFHDGGTVTFLQYNDPAGGAVLKPIDYSQGNVQRTSHHDARAVEGYAISIVVDAVKGSS